MKVNKLELKCKLNETYYLNIIPKKMKFKNQVFFIRHIKIIFKMQKKIYLISHYIF